jgi:hypothetical protein
MHTDFDNTAASVMAGAYRAETMVCGERQIGAEVH